MSYYTQLSLSWNDADYARGTLTVDAIADAAKGFLAEHHWSEDVIGDLRQSCEFVTLGPPGFNSAYADGVIQLIEHISKQFPEVVFYAKGAGEEFHDIWIREFKGGEVTVQRGPFDELAPPPSPELMEAFLKFKEESAAQEQRKRKDKPWWKRIL
jgi:hypothetical protein